MAFTPGTLFLNSWTPFRGALTDTYTTVPAEFTAGVVVRSATGREFKLIQNGEASASITVDKCCTYKESTTDDYVVVIAVSGDAVKQKPVCVPCTTITFGKYGFATVKGLCDQSGAALTDDTPADGAMLAIFGAGALKTTATAGQAVGYSKNGEVYIGISM